MSNIAILLFPFLILVGTTILCLLLEAFNIARRLSPPITIIGGFLALYSVILDVNGGITYLFGNPNDFLDTTFTVGLMVMYDFYRFFAILFLIVLIFVAISSSDYMKTDHNLGVYYSLLTLVSTNSPQLVFLPFEQTIYPRRYSLTISRKNLGFYIEL